MKSSILFKYRHFDKGSLELLLNRELWFAKPSSLNDPFEGEASSSEVLEAVWQHYPLSENKQAHYGQMIEQMLSNTGICSFSRTRKNQLMWAHYANEHKGICIGFKEELLTPKGSNIFALDVDYQNEYPYEGMGLLQII
ncbi:DUF2971 domain-containing protein [Aliivibrio fischeri]|uniref:DUF2971 domain-containing protein n=1 Tax=Aliivibrio fischeri TaxID=668 RepID=UPI00084C5F04|nr:DUF2971 domain-containing protein [Aliivibrio fischeri]OED53092.1 hypothetical protein BEI47_18125 [Aliivibrio fischeri]